MWFRNCQILQFAEPFKLPAEAMEAELRHKVFVPCGSTDALSMGWVSPTGDSADPLAYSANGFVLVTLKIEEKLVPSRVIKDMLAEKIAEFEATTGLKVRRKDKEQWQDEIYHTLLPRAFSRITQISAYIDPVKSLLIVDAASPSKAEKLTEFLRKTLGSLKIQLLPLQDVPTLLTEWIARGRYPAEFVIEDGCVLEDLANGGMIRCQGEDLQSEDIKSLLRANQRSVVQIRLSWCDQIRFVLKQDLSICGLKFLDTMREQLNDVSAESAKQQFDAEFCLMTESLRYFFDQLQQVFCKPAATAEKPEVSNAG